VIDPSGPIHTLSVNDFTYGLNSFGARAFVQYLDAINYGGTNTWSLPVVYGINEQFNDSQFGQLYAEFAASPSSMSLFSNLGDRYWETQGAQGATCNGAWQWIGGDDCAPKTDHSGVLAVAPGEVTRSHPYTLINLGTLGSKYLYGAALNDEGQVVGFSTKANGTPEAFLYDRGRLQALPNLAGAQPFAISEVGQIVGALHVGTAVHAFSYIGGRTTDIAKLTHNLGFPESFATGVYNSGQIVGLTESVTSYRAFLYAHGALIDLGTLGGIDSEAVAINDRGQITGAADTKISSNPNNTGSDVVQPHAFIYTNRAMRDLGTLGGSFSVGLAINSAGEVAGNSYADTEDLATAFVYRKGEMVNLGLGYISSAQGINDHGDAVGYATDSRTGDSRAFLYRNGKVHDLGSLIDPRTPIPASTTLSAQGINNDGVILVNAYNTVTGQENVYLLEPRCHRDNDGREGRHDFERDRRDCRDHERGSGGRDW
jgi:probable HAF family extracellular repeat protein